MLSYNLSDYTPANVQAAEAANWATYKATEGLSKAQVAEFYRLRNEAQDAVELDDNPAEALRLYAASTAALSA